MKRISLLCIVWTALFSPCLFANETSYYLGNPYGWMRMLPTGEMPGWKKDFWFNSEIHHASVWNAPLTMRNKNNGQIYEYHADFEQTSLILELGGAISDDFSFSIVAPYAYRGGGIMDQFIDAFHVAIGSDRFGRNQHQRHVYDMYFKTDGEDKLTELRNAGFGNIKTKLKYWPIKWKNSLCACGLAFSLQYKFPTDEMRHGFTSGTNDYSGLVHLGIPLFKESAFWSTAALSYTKDDILITDWPRRHWHQMYDFVFDFGLGSGWGLMLQARMESPILNKESLEYVDSELNPEQRRRNRVASGWNGLVHWRGSQSIGLRYLFRGGTKINLHLIEDWAQGRYDESGDTLYVNNAPDVEVALQVYVPF